MKTTRIKFNGLSPGLKRVARADGAVSGAGEGASSGNTAASTFEWGNFGEILAGAGSLFGQIIGGIGSRKNNDNADQGTKTTNDGANNMQLKSKTDTETKSNTVAWVIGGVVAIGAIVGLIFLTRKKK